MEERQDQQPPNQTPIQPDPQTITNKKPVPVIAIVGFLLSIFMAPVGFITSIVAWRKIHKFSLGGKWLAIAGVAIGALFSLPLLFFVWLFIVLGAWHGNQAQKDFKPIAKQIVSLGGAKLCDNGDGGYGLDNTIPWYQVYYIVPDTTDLTNKVKSIANQQGYQLNSDTSFINQLKGLPDEDGSYSGLYGDEQFNPKSDYLIGQNSNKSLSVTVNRQTSVALYCGTDYGKKQSTGSNAILDFKLMLPDTGQ